MNPELTQWTGPLGLPRFDLIQDADFAPAFDACLKLAEDAVEAIAANPQPPTFDNTVAALETAEEPLNRLCAVFYTLAGVDSNPAREELQRQIAPRLAAHGAKTSMDPRLFDRVEAVFQDRDTLAPQQQRLTELTLRGLRRAGAGLTGAARDRMAQVRERLAVLSTDFAQNVLTDERDFTMAVADDRLAGLPDWLLRAMRAAARERGQPGQIVTLNRSLIVPFLEYAEDRALREAAWRAWTARGDGSGAGGAKTDNRPIAAEILALRHERATLLGYADFASYKLEPEMAGSAANVEALLKQVWTPAKARAEADAAHFTGMLHDSGVNGALEPWDWRFYAERRRKAEHDLDEAAVQPYLTLDAMIGAVFDTATRLFGLAFREFQAPLWSPGVRAWEITRDGRQMAVFLGDYFARPRSARGRGVPACNSSTISAPASGRSW